MGRPSESVEVSMTPSSSSSSTKRPTTPLLERHHSANGQTHGHRKNPSTSSSISSKTSSFFDTPTPSATPPPPDNPPSSSTSFPSLDSATLSSYSPTRTSLFASQQALKPLGPSVTSRRPSSSSPLSLVPKHASTNSSLITPPPLAPIASTSTLPPAPHALRLATTPQYLLGRGLRASVYLSAIQARSSTTSAKGKEREWTLAATKIPLEDDGEEGREALCREAEVLAWLGKKRAGIVGFIGLVDLVEAQEDGARVRAVRTPTPTSSRTTKTQALAAQASFETFSFSDPSPEELIAAFSDGEQARDDEGAGRRRTRPVLLLECASVFGTIDTLVKQHPELVTEQLWISWAGVLASAGEWLEARGVVRESLNVSCCGCLVPFEWEVGSRREADLALLPFLTSPFSPLCTLRSSGSLLHFIADRDIKPQNILLTSSLSPLLTDFGSSLLPFPTTSSSPFPPITTGTTPYSSPELLLHPETVSYPSDVFSLGATLYVAITGKEPFKGVSGNREMVFWVGKGGFWEWEERRRAAAWGGEVGVRRGGSLREPGVGGHHGPSHVGAGAGVHHHAVPGRLLAEGGVGGEPRRVGSWECLRAKGEQGWGWDKAAAATPLPTTSSARLRASLEQTLLAPSTLDNPTSPPTSSTTKQRSPLLTTLLSPLLPLPHPPTNPTHAQTSTIVPPESPPASPISDDDDEANLPPMDGPPMFFPSSTPYHPHQVSDSARRLLRRMLEPRGERRAGMREVREWAERRGWKAEEVGSP